MTPVAVAGLVLAALMVGLWWGERGRRIAAERLAVYGTPQAPLKATSTVPTKTHRPTQETQDRLEAASTEFSEQAVKSGMEDLRADYLTRGLSVDEERLRREAIQMLSGQDVMDG